MCEAGERSALQGPEEPAVGGHYDRARVFGEGQELGIVDDDARL